MGNNAILIWGGPHLGLRGKIEFCPAKRPHINVTRTPTTLEYNAAG
jgi:hypothetical protein